MIVAVDTSSFVAFLSGARGDDVDILDRSLEERRAVFPAVVLSELLSDHRLGAEVINLLKQIPLLDIGGGYWERVGRLRAKVISKGYKARLADALIAQNCIDHNVPLITRDQDFRHFVKYGNLVVLNE